MLSWLFQEIAGTGEALRKENEFPFCKGNLHFVKEISLCTQKRRITLLHKRLINGESTTPICTTNLTLFCYTSLGLVQFSHSVMSDSLQLHELQHTRPPCPTSTPRVYSNSCPSSQWCHPAISSSVIPFSSCPQSLTASGSFPMSQLFIGGSQSIGVSASLGYLPIICLLLSKSPLSPLF